MKKQILSIVTAIAIANSSLHAWNPKDDFLSNTTGAGTYNDNLTQSKYMSGGSAVFKFKNKSNTARPLFDIQPPQVKSGCNGISVTGGMLQVLGLDGLVEQLRNASTAVLYGIVVGMIYSTPPINQALDQIRQVANYLQKFNADACNIGRQIGAQFAQKEGVKDTLAAPTSVANYLIGKGDELVTELLSGAPVANELATSFKDQMSSNNAETKDTNARAIYKEYGPYFEVIGLAGVLLRDDLLSIDSDITKKTITGTTESEKLYLVFNSLYGDIGLSGKALDYFLKNATYISDVIAFGKVNIGNPEAVASLDAASKEVVSSLVTPEISTGAPKVIISSTSPTYTDNEKINMLIYGKTDGTLSTTTVSVKTIDVVYAKSRVLNTNERMEMLSTYSVNSGSADIAWQGIYPLTSDYINCILAGTSTCTKIPIAFGKFSSHLEAIKELKSKLVKMQQSQEVITASTAYYIQTLALANAIILSQQMLDALAQELYSKSLERGNPSNKETAEKLSKDIASTKEYLANHLITKFNDENILYQTVDQVFDGLKVEIRKTQLK